MINRIYKNVKNVIRKSAMPDPYFVSKYACSPYASCLHACKYCDGRAEKYHVEGDFEKDITIRQNFAEIFRRDLKRVREPGTISFGSGISDPYQLVEEHEMFFRRLIPSLYGTNLSLSFMTKSSLILRDIDLLKPFAQSGKLQIMVSIAHVDDNIRQIFEPNASSITDRFNVLQHYKEIGAYVGVLAMPFLPGVSDSEKSISMLFSKAVETGVDFVMPGGLTLRPGRQKNLYFSIIRDHFPVLLELYTDMFRENRSSGSPAKNYQDRLSSLYWKLMEKYQLNPHVEHKFFKQNYPLYDEILILLNHMTKIYSSSDRINLLKSAYRAYSKWLLIEKKKFNRQRSLKYTQLEDITRYALFEKQLIFKNDKLLSFLEKAVSPDHYFDYLTKSLI